jgi:hypothetical protein
MFTSLTPGIRGILWSSFLIDGKVFSSTNTYWNSSNNALNYVFSILLLVSSKIDKENNWPVKPHMVSFKFLWTFVVVIIYNLASSTIPFNSIVLFSFLNEIVILKKSNRTWEYVIN